MPLVGPYENEALKTTGGDNQMIGDAWRVHGTFTREARDAWKQALKAVPPLLVPKIKDLSGKKAGQRQVPVSNLKAKIRPWRC